MSVSSYTQNYLARKKELSEGRSKAIDLLKQASTPKQLTQKVQIPTTSTRSVGKPSVAYGDSPLTKGAFTPAGGTGSASSSASSFSQTARDDAAERLRQLEQQERDARIERAASRRGGSRYMGGRQESSKGGSRYVGGSEYGIGSLSNEASSLRKQLGLTFPQQAVKTAVGMAKAVPAGLEGFVGSTANALTTLYQGGQASRDAQNREYLEEYSDGLRQAKRNMEAMLEDNARSPGTWSDGDIKGQQNIIDDWQRKYDAMSKVVGENIERKATQASYKLSDEISADSARRLEEAKQGLALPGRVLVDATGSLVQNVADMGVNTLLGTPGFMGSFAFRSFGGGTQQARQDMEAMGTADQEDAYKKQVLFGLASMAKEIGTEKISNVSLPFGAAYGKGSIDDITQSAIDRAVARFAGSAAGKRALERGLNFVNSAAGEGMEELIGDWIEWQLPRIYGGEVDAAKDVLENSLYDFLVGAASGGLGDVTFRGAGKAFDTITGNTAQNTGAKLRESGNDVVQATIDDGLASGSGTISNTMAQELQNKLDRGDTVTDREIGQLYQANVEAIDAENAAERQVQQETQPKQAPAATQTAQEAANTQTNEMTRQAPQERTEAVKALDTARVARASSVLGENGQKALNATYDGQTGAQEYYGGFSAYYQAGVSGQDINKVNSEYSGALTPAQKYAAYTSGKNDAAVSLKREKEAARFAPVAGEKSGLVYDDFVRQAVESGRTAQDVNQETRTYLTADTAERINTLAKDLGVRVRFVDSVAGGRANAQISGSEVLVERNNPNPVMTIVGHELTHRMQQLAPEAYRSFRDIVMQEEGQSDRVQQRIADYARQGVTLDTEAAMDEVAADYAGRMMDNGKVLDDFIQKHQDNRTVLQKLRDAFRELWQKLTGKEKNQAKAAEQKLTVALEAATAQAEQNRQNAAQTQDGEARYSINEQFGQNIQEWNKDGRPAGEQFVLGTTGPVLQGLGAIESDIYINGDKISAILDQHPEMTIREIQRIPDILEDPVLVMKSRNVGRGGRQNTRLVMFGSVKAQDGRPVMCVLDLRPMDRGFVVSDMQKVTSAYTKDSNPVQYLQNSEILHADEKRTVPLLRTIGFHMPIELQRSGSMGSISYNKQNVNLTGEKFSDVVKVEEDGGKARYSLKEGTISKSYEALLKENDLLRERVDYWKGQTKRTERITTDKKAVEKAARALIRDYGAQIDLEDIQGNLQSLYDYIASGSEGKDELTYTEARRRAENIAQTLVENALTVDDSLYQDYRDLRKHLKDIKLTISEADSQGLTDYNDFRKRNFGRLNIGKGRTNIDQVYQELAEMWPGLFNEQEYNNPADQLYHIAEVLDTVGATQEYNPFSGDMRNAVAGAANEILERFFDLPQTRATFADRQAAKLDKLRWENRDKVQKAIARERGRRAEEVKKLKEHYRERDAAGRESRNARELRGKIIRHVRKLSQKLLKPSDKMHIPENLRQATAAALEAINLESKYEVVYGNDAKYHMVKPGTERFASPTKRTEAFQTLREQYEKISRGETDFTGVLDPVNADLKL